MSSYFSRRSFLQVSSATLGAAALSNPLTVRAAIKSDNRLRVAFVGTGNQGMGLLKRVLKWDLADVVAVCDVNKGSYGYKDESHFYGREPAQKMVLDHLAKKKKSGVAGSGCDCYANYEDVFARDDIDAVFLVVPDHWHTPLTILAAQSGKHVYCEKPLTLTVNEGEEMLSAVKKNNVLLQCGSHERSNPISRFVCEAVKSGAVGEIKRIVTNVGYNNKVGPGPGWKAEPVPETFDYQTWLGPAPEVPYHHDRCLYRFRFHYDYSGGQITNFGAHSNDMAHWGMNWDLGGPKSIECIDAKFLPTGSLFNTATETHFRCEYDNGVELICQSGSPSVQVKFEGTNGWMLTGYGGTKASDPALLKDMPDYDKKKQIDPHSLHMQNFVQTVLGNDELRAPGEVGNASAILCHLANVVIRRFPEHGQQKLMWDHSKLQFTNDDSANDWLSRPRRSIG